MLKQILLNLDFRAKLVKVAAPFIMRFAAKTKTESISPDSN